jgi:T-complex protein 1 subunit beta
MPFILAMETDKIKIFDARLKVDGTGKLAELERAEWVRYIPPSLLYAFLLINRPPYAFFLSRKK